MENASDFSQPMVFFAEDDDDFLYIVRHALDQIRSGEIVKPVGSFGELMKCLGSGEYPHLIILDLNTSPNDWRGALRNLRGDKRCKNIPIVILSAFIEQDDIDLCESYGCACIRKPESFEGWKTCLEEIIRTNFTLGVSERNLMSYPPPLVNEFVFFPG
ncbi:MAG: response regulator [Desulfobacteraceae bacterium]|jgi:CheY-like chemotaxis protein|nr:MAG: response regulator [Desulfobacteraceae bacterium]